MPASRTPSPKSSAHTARPSLPPLSSLGLLNIRRRPNSNIMPNTTSNANLNPLGLSIPAPFETNMNESTQRMRQCSITSTTSSCTTTSRSSSPTDPSASASTSLSAARRGSIQGRTDRRHHPYLPTDKYRCILSDRFEDADAMLVLPLPPDMVDENNQPIKEKLVNFRSDRAYLATASLLSAFAIRRLAAACDVHRLPCQPVYTRRYSIPAAPRAQPTAQ
ncbi:uncharacterized protein BXZ73DRAFT_105473 [Epithele typhae]|uniref:uncharacterized protein n=1 Tax=Epithele typhae TaxID=378194 RepID=UPI002008D9FB|nr:uncharacterized protein BXZ73DRAFT_105473 [Epithele typhae]KAH9917650.1 hypothetical protein BXZ73DRAFT_105473 [Epithele typhae]